MELPEPTGLLAGIVIVLGAVAVLVVANMGARGTLPRQYWAGIRLPATLRSDEAWRAAHVAAAPMMRAGGIIALIAGAGTIVAALAAPPLAFWLVIIAAAALLGFILAASVPAVRAARRAP
jgi:SdpI/YfhL protein family